MRGGECGDKAGEWRECGSQGVQSEGRLGLEATGPSVDEAHHVGKCTLGGQTKALTWLWHHVHSEYDEGGDRNIMTHRS